MKVLLGLMIALVATVAAAETKDCNGTGTVNIWLGSAAQAVVEHNTVSTKRLEDIVAARKKKDGGRSFEKIANSYNCTFIARDPNAKLPDGLAGYIFTEKQHGSAVEQRLSQGVPGSFQLWLVGGVKKLIAGGKGCYEVEYRDEQGDLYKYGYLAIDPQLPVPEVVKVCN